MLSRRQQKYAAQLVVRALDEYNRIKDYHHLLYMALNNETPDEMELLLHCYTILSEPHLEELENTLSAIRQSLRETY